MKLIEILKIKNFLSFLIYLLAFLMGLNFYFGKTIKENNDKLFFKKLKEIDYFKQDKDPYADAKKLKIHPSNYFSLNIRSNNIDENAGFSLDKYNYRNNPYNTFG